MKGRKRFFWVLIFAVSIVFLFFLAGCGEQTFRLRYEASEGGIIEGKASQTIKAGESGEEVTATPNDGFEFVAWSDGVKTPKRRDGDIRFDLTVQADFQRILSAEAKTYSLNYSAGEGGIIGGNTSQTVKEGENGEAVTAVPIDGYKFSKWSDGVTEASRRERDVHEDVIVQAEFSPVEVRFVHLKYSASKGGEIEGKREQNVREGGDGETVTAVAAKGYNFLQWTDNVKTPMRRDKNVHVDLDVQALFTQIINVLEYKTDGNGTIEGESIQAIGEGERGEIVSAVPNEGYEFDRWGDGKMSPTRQDYGRDTDRVFIALFKPIPSGVKAYRLHYGASGGGTVTGDLVQTVYEGKDGNTVHACPDKGYDLLQWSDGVKELKRQDKNVNGNVSVTAIFEERYCTVRYEAGEGGTIEGKAVQRVRKDSDAEERVTAVPQEGYVFERWSDGVRLASRLEKNLQRDVSVTAIFTKLSFTVEYLVGDSLGNIEGIRKQTVLYGESSTPVTAVGRNILQSDLSISQSDFVVWSDGKTEATRQETNVVSDMTFTAYFGYTVTFSAEGGGKIEGDFSQTMLPGREGEPVKAVPNDGYVFAGWSDLSDSYVHGTGCVVRRTEYIAYFEPIEKVFEYEYGELFKKPLEKTVKIERETLKKSKFIVPKMEGYEFCGWYADEGFRQKVADETGRLMLGWYTFALEIDRLYAKWQKQGETENVYSILLAVTGEVHALLPSHETGEAEEIDYVMTGIERKIFAFIPRLFEDHLNRYFNKYDKVEIDVYFTIDPFGTREARASADRFELLTEGDKTGYAIEPQGIDELGDLIGKYSYAFNFYRLNNGGLDISFRNLKNAVNADADFQKAVEEGRPLQELFSGLDDLNIQGLQFAFDFLNKCKMRYLGRG